MTHKTAYIWGPISSFSGPLAAWLLQKDWQVHVATKPALDLFSLSPLELKSSAQGLLERALGGHERLRVFQDRLRLIDPQDAGDGHPEAAQGLNVYGADESGSDDRSTDGMQHRSLPSSTARFILE